ncbi:MAG: preprotein translocase subunit YajC [Deltaproteobacteria bacterium]|nr:preprotein translocase subunit YajC [Deltaproteobacteria bacterium]
MINVAYAQDAAAAAAPANAGMHQLVMIGMIFVIFYFLLIRPQQKQQKALKKMIADAKRGDEIITTSGLHGRIVETKEEFVMVQVANNVTLKFDRSAIQSIKGYEADAKGGKGSKKAA